MPTSTRKPTRAHSNPSAASAPSAPPPSESVPSAPPPSAPVPADLAAPLPPSSASPLPATPLEPAPSLIQLIPHSLLQPSPLNPRQHVDEAAVRDLAESIAAQGLLHNLIARPVGESYELAAGERRYRAVALLIEAGRLPPDHPLPVKVQDLSDLELLQVAASENGERAPMHPLEEAAAYARMLSLGADIESIALRMGQREQAVRQRLALHERLCAEAKDALYQQDLTLTQAQQLTAASPELQRHLLERILAAHEDPFEQDWTAQDIRDFLATRLLKVKDAIFPLGDYQGELTNNLFDPEHEAAFCDTEQALALQAQAVEALKQQYLETWPWVDIIEPWQLRTWRYVLPSDDPASCDDGAPVPAPSAAASTAPHATPSNTPASPTAASGVVITADRHTWQVAVYEGVLRAEATVPSSGSSISQPESRGVASISSNAPSSDRTLSSRKPKDAYTRKHLVLARQLKSRALQTALLEQHHTCLVLAVMGLMGVGEVTLKTEQTETYHGLAGETPALKAVYDAHLPLLNETFTTWEVSAYPLRVRGNDEIKTLVLYRYLRDLPESDLHDLFNALIAWCFGSWPTEQPDTGDSLLAREIAQDLELDMAKHVSMDEAFLSLYRKSALAQIASDLGVPFDVSGMTIKATVAYLQPRLKGRRYLPGLLQVFEWGTQPPEGILSDTELEQAA